MVGKRVASTMTMAGGVIYALVGVLIIQATSEITSQTSSIATLEANGLSASEIIAAVHWVGAIDIATGLLIVLGGFLLGSEDGRRRRTGGILAIVMMVIGAITSLGGFVIGLMLTLVGSVLGLRYRPEDAEMDRSAYPASPADRPSPAQGVGVVPRFCPNCGAALRDGSVYCASCGEKVVE